MADYINFAVGQGIQAHSNHWYQNVQRLGTGGNAVTFLVLCTSGPHYGVLFALKIFYRLSAPERRDRFLQEIEFLQECDHPSVMRVFDAGVFKVSHGGTLQEHPFVVAEYLPLRLADIIRAGTSSIAEKLSFSLQMLSALNHLTNLDPQVVHRDIKPQNIFVKGKACVLGDFGLMKLLDNTEEVDRDVFRDSVKPGMPFFYRTPDLVAYATGDAKLTVRSDVFQLGLVLAELFTGRNPARRPAKPLDPVELDKIGLIPGGLGGSVASLLNRMLEPDAAYRDTVDLLLPKWQSIFQDAVEQAHKLDGRAI